MLKQRRRGDDMVSGVRDGRQIKSSPYKKKYSNTKQLHFLMHKKNRTVFSCSSFLNFFKRMQLHHTLKE
jgi:hypothetical protein